MNPINDKEIGILLLFLAVTIEAFGQIFLKLAATKKTSHLGEPKHLSMGIACFVVEAIIWTMVLRSLAVSVAYPMGSLSFVAVIALSSLWLKEKVSAKRWIGVGLILGGNAMVGLN